MRLSKRFISALVVLLLCVFSIVPQAWADDTAGNAVGNTTESTTARPSTTGALAVKGNALVDAQGNAVQLRGVSTHGLQWFPEYVNKSLFKQLSSEWDANLIRLPVYSDNYSSASAKDAAAIMETLHTGIDAAISADMYALVDWHTLKDNDPNKYVEQAKEFFGRISSKYAQSSNIIYGSATSPTARPHGRRSASMLKRSFPSSGRTIRMPSSSWEPPTTTATSCPRCVTP